SDGDWKFVTYYDTDEVQLFDLSSDIGEYKNLAGPDKDRAARMKREHQQWLKAINAQRNTPNPDFDAALFQKLYVDFDPSRPVVRSTAAEMERDMQAWRALMNEVVAGQRPAKKAKAK